MDRVVSRTDCNHGGRPLYAIPPARNRNLRTSPLRDPTRAALGLAATAILWSTGGVAIKAVDLSPMSIAGERGLLAAVFLLAILPGRLDSRRKGPGRVPSPAPAAAASPGVRYGLVSVEAVRATPLVRNPVFLWRHP